MQGKEEDKSKEKAFLEQQLSIIIQHEIQKSRFLYNLV